MLSVDFAETATSYEGITVELVEFGASFYLTKRNVEQSLELFQVLNDQ